MVDRPKVVVVGAGFGGVQVARSLLGAPVDVTIIDRQNYTTFQPLLYQVATSGLPAADVAYPVRGMFPRQDNVRFRYGTVVGVDWDARLVQLDGQEPLAFDHLVLAAGAGARWFGVPGAAEWAFPLYTLDEASHLRNHIVQQFEAAEVVPERIDDGVLTFVVVGGGPTGVETAGALSELVTKVFRSDYPDLDVARARVVLVEAQDSVLTALHPKSQAAAVQGLEERGVELRLGESVAEVSRSSVKLSGGEVLPAHTVVWCAGVSPNPLAETLGLPTGRGGRVTVSPDLSVVDRPGAWAIGDVAAVPDKDGMPLPQVAPVAMQSGRHVGRQIARLVTGRGTQRFRYKDKGTMATIGRRDAVADLPGGLHLTGTIGWLSWLALHLLYLSGVRNRVSVLLNWGWAYVTWDRPRLILRPQRR